MLCYKVNVSNRGVGINSARKTLKIMGLRAGPNDRALTELHRSMKLSPRLMLRGSEMSNF